MSPRIHFANSDLKLSNRWPVYAMNGLIPRLAGSAHDEESLGERVFDRPLQAVDLAKPGRLARSHGPLAVRLLEHGVRAHP